MSIYLIIAFLLWSVHGGYNEEVKRQKRYLIFTPSTQYGVFATVSIPLHSESTTSVAWFIEANYYNVANATYFDELLGDIETTRKKRSAEALLTRTHFYTTIETMLEKHGYPGRPCLLRAICASGTSHFLHNGLLGDLLHLALTPSTSVSEDNLEDEYYEAEYQGLVNDCSQYTEDCPKDPLLLISESIHEFVEFE